MSLTPRTAAVVWGPPQAYPYLRDCDLIRTMTTDVRDLEAVRAAHPGCHVQMVVQLGEFVATPDPSRKQTSIRQAYALLAQEEYRDLVVRPDQAPEAIRDLWWGLAALRLHDTARLDDYLRTQGRMIAGAVTRDLADGLVDSVHIDTAAWTMPAKREFLGCDLAGPELVTWIRARCDAFATGFLMETRGVLASVNGVSSYSLRLDQIASGWGQENFGTRHYHVGHYSGLREAVIAQMREAIAAIEARPKLGLVVNPIPYAYQDREDMLLYLRAHAILYVGLQAHAAMQGVPVYWHCERDRIDNPLWVQKDYPLVWQAILDGGWRTVKTPLHDSVLVTLEKPGLHLALSIDDQDVVRIHRTTTSEAT